MRLNMKKTKTFIKPHVAYDDITTNEYDRRSKIVFKYTDMT